VNNFLYVQQLPSPLPLLRDLGFSASAADGKTTREANITSAADFLRISRSR